MIKKPNFFVFTGGPGVGKTPRPPRLEARGETAAEESAGGGTREQGACGGPAAPWIDNQAYVDQTAARDIANSARMAGEPRRVFFDRGIADSYRANGSEP